MTERENLVQRAVRTTSIYTGWRRRFDRGIQLLKTFPISQVFDRIYKRACTKLGWRYLPKNQTPSLKDNPAFARLYELERPSDDTIDDSLIAGKMTLLNQTYKIGFPIDWATHTAILLGHTDQNTPERPNHLWRFQLHYHEWFRQLSPTLAFRVMDHWIESNPVTGAQADAWHPYCISRRIPVWIELLTKHREASIDTQMEDRHTSLFDQYDFLSRNLETDLRGNHLLENLFAIAFAACYFDGDASSKNLARIEDRIARELDFQICPHGEHYELSPMYHCVVTANLLRLAIVADGVHPSLCTMATRYARQMYLFLESIVCPDGEVPLLSDSCFLEGPSVDQIRQLAAEIGIKQEPASDAAERSRWIGNYWKHETNTSWLLLDTGDLAAPGLPGHAHCDLMNVVGSLHGQRVLVDSGNGSYDLDETRKYCRSSVAHNVVTINGYDHADVWSKFRMGYRGSTVKREHGQQGDFDWVVGSHNAYRRIGVAKVKRFLAADRSLPVWLCIDSVESDSLETGTGELALDGYLHFDPEIDINRINAESFELTIKDHRYQLTFTGCESVELADSIVCREFGNPMDNVAMIYSASLQPNCLNPRFGWVLAPAAFHLETKIPTDTESFFELTVDDQLTSFQLDQP
ncbi:MAG: alginate lyase family protein [Planctomycetota bacterium]